ncbi:MAG: nuclear transport factor 2 family protein [Candidatus Sulfotelmatobacter sp.]
MWKFALIVLLLSAHSNAQAVDKSDGDRSRILALENAWNQAVREKDTPALKLLLGPELVYVDYDGTLMDKAQYLASVQSQVVQPERIVSESMNVHLYGTAAVVEGIYRETGEKNGKTYTLRERFSDTWIRRNESWECVASHSTLVNH